MRLEKKRIRLLIILTSIALAGLLILQVYLLKQTYNTKMQAFHQNVQSALNDIVNKIETRETAARIIAFTMTDSLGLPFPMPNIKTFSDSNMQGKAQIICMDSQANNTKVIDTIIHIPAPKPGQFKKTSGYTYKMVTDSAQMDIDIISDEANFHFKHFSSKNKKRIFVEKVMQDLNNLSVRVSLKERLNQVRLDSLLAISLNEKGIDIPYIWGVVYNDADSLLLSNNKKFKDKILSSQYKSRLFPNDLLARPNDLKIYFPDQTYYLFRQSGLPILVSMLFIFTIIFSFYYTVNAIQKQKRFSQTLSAFINNMTHEFKTPISTISLASDTLINPTVINNKKRLVKYGSIIHDESKRMRKQVEKILQMAEVETGRIILKKINVDVHELLREAIKNMTLVVEKRGGYIKSNFQAILSIIDADMVHLQNIIVNILDNAVKYSEGKPEINIFTSNINEKILIEFEDNGIGMKLDDQKRAFEKYYRVPTGDIHNVKGFGLGLSYVELMTKAHDGNVSLESYYQKGTTIRLTFPTIINS